MGKKINLKGSVLSSSPVLRFQGTSDLVPLKIRAIARKHWDTARTRPQPESGLWVLELYHERASFERKETLPITYHVIFMYDLVYFL